MRTPEPLRNNPFRFRKRRSVYTKLYSEGRPDPIRPIDNMVRYRGTSGQVSPKSYISRSPEGYLPHPGFMQIPHSDYQAYNMQDMPMSNFGSTDEFRFAAMKLAGFGPSGGEVEYDDCLMTEEVFQQHIESLREQFPPEFDTNEIASHILAACSQNEEIVTEQDPREMIEIQMAVEQIRAEPLAGPNTEPSDFGLAIPQDFFEQPEQTFEEFYEMQPPTEPDHRTPVEADFDQQAMFEQPIEEMIPLADLEPQPLEDIIEAEQMQYEDVMPDDMTDMSAFDSFSMPQEFIDQQMPEVAEHMDPMEPDPHHDGYGVMPQEMYDEQMPDEMMDPLMMDPYMMPGPWGPMPGPGPGGP